MKRTKSRLTPEQRKEFADMLAMGIPEAVIEELDGRITAYVGEWARKVKDHVLKLRRKPVLINQVPSKSRRRRRA